VVCKDNEVISKLFACYGSRREFSNGLHTRTHVVQIHAPQDRKSAEDKVDSEIGILGERRTDILDEGGDIGYPSETNEGIYSRGFYLLLEEEVTF